MFSPGRRLTVQRHYPGDGYENGETHDACRVSHAGQLITRGSPNSPEQGASHARVCDQRSPQPVGRLGPEHDRIVIHALALHYRP